MAAVHIRRFDRFDRPSGGDPAHMSENHVQLTGRLGANLSERALPSGDALLAFHIVVDRERPKTATKVDAVPCHVTTKALIAKLGKFEPGDVIAIEGSLRRRFWRTPQGIGSAVEVHATKVVRVP